MPLDTTYLRGSNVFRWVTAAAVGAYDLIQTALGQAASWKSNTGASAGETISLTTDGTWTLTKTTGFAAVAGDPAYWDYSANAVYYKPVNDRDSYIGVFADDAASTDSTCSVVLNAVPTFALDLAAAAFDSTLVGTPAAGGFGYPVQLGGTVRLALNATNEAQKVELLSVDGLSRDANPVVEFSFRVQDGGAGAQPDFNIGLANGTHASDFDSVTEFVGFHLDGTDTKIYAQSRDGTTTVAATDTLVTYTAGGGYSVRVEGKIDARDPANVKLYLNGSRVLASTVFKIDNATGPLRLVAHLEKTASATTFKIDLDKLRVRISEQ